MAVALAISQRPDSSFLVESDVIQEALLACGAGMAPRKIPD
jgi:hypothetical protein